MWGVPIAIVAFLGVLLWRSTTLLNPYRPIDPAAEATRVQVVGLDWKWLFIYPDEGIATVGELAFPATRPLALELTSDTVMQSFIIGALGGQIYAMPGMRTQLHLSADRPGSYTGENMQYSGEGFHTQKFQATAMTDAGFAGWLDAARRVAVPLDAAAYATLSERGTKDELRAAFPAAMMQDGAVAFRSATPACSRRSSRGIAGPSRSRRNNSPDHCRFKTHYPQEPINDRPVELVHGQNRAGQFFDYICLAEPDRQ